MNKGVNKTTISKYLQYVFEILKSHKMIRWDSVVLKDYALLHKYFPKGKDEKSLSSAYDYMIKTLKSLDVIREYNDGKYLPNKYCKRYSINVSELYALSSEYLSNSSQIPYDISKEFLEDDIDYIVTEEGRFFNPNVSHTLSPSVSPSPLHINVTKVENIVWRLDPIKMNRVKFKKEGFTATEIENIEILMAEYFKNYNEVYQECKYLCDWINSKLHNGTRFNVNVRGKESDQYLTLGVSGRQYNPLCNIDNRLTGRRDWELKQKGYDKSIDLHSAIFAVARLLNYGEFDLDWDIKRELITNYDLLTKEEKTNWKTLLNRCFYNKTAGQAWTQYHGVNKNVYHTRDFISQEEFTELFNGVQELTGGTYLYMGNMNLYESLFELRIMKKALEEDIDIQNVYDCFYFHSEDEDKVKEIILQVAEDFNRRKIYEE